MLRINLNQTKPGMQLALPVYNPEQKTNVLLRTGYTLTAVNIKRLEELNVDELWIKYPGTEAIKKQINPEVLAQREVLGKNICEFVSNAQHKTNAHLSFNNYIRSVSDLITELLQNPSSAMVLDNLNSRNNNLMKHSTNVAFMSILMGIKLDSYIMKQRKRLKSYHAKNITNLGVGAMLHDIGLLQIDPNSVKNYEETRQSDDGEYKRHTRVGYEMVKGKIDPSAGAVILQHHQHFNGTGFPQNLHGVTDGSLAGNKIHVFARIVNVADTFDTLHNPRADITIPMVRAMKMMLQPPIMNWFDPVVLRAFFCVVAPYPPGTLLRLSDGRYAVTVDHHPASPCRPIVQILDSPEEIANQDSDNENRILPIIDLEEQPHIHVVEAAGEDVSDYQFHLPPEMSTLMPQKRKRLIAG